MTAPPASIRKKMAGFIRQLSIPHGADNFQHLKSPQQGCFIHQYLNGEVKRKQPDILFGKSCQELPVHEIDPLSPDIFAAYTGPKGGLTRVNRTGRPIKIDDPEVSFIDDESPPISSNVIEDINQNVDVPNHLYVNGDNEECSDKENDPDDDVPKTYDHEIAGVKNWNLLHRRAYGKATTLYECHPITRENAGEPIADTFAMVARQNNSILALADGVNWGTKACLAARCAVHGCMDYLNKALFRDGAKIQTTTDVFVSLLRSFHAAHNLILMENGMLTTLCAAIVCKLKGRNEFVVCTCNVGDSLAYVYSKKYGVREITQGSHDIYSMRDMRDALGALGPVDGQNPELNNLTISMTLVEEGDVVFLTSDGISDNFDPVVGKFALPKKADDRELSGIKSHTISSESSKGSTFDGSKTNRLLKRLPCNSPNQEDLIPLVCMPIVEAYQRHELTLLRMEDLLRNGVTDGDQPCESAQNLCEQLIYFATKLTIAKRKILEDPDLYSKNPVKKHGTSPVDLNEITNNEQRNLRKKIGPKLASVPGKLDHASVVAYDVGIYESHSGTYKSSVNHSRNVYSERIEVHLPIQRESSL